MKSLPGTRIEVSLLFLDLGDVLRCYGLERMTIYIGVLGFFLEVIRVGVEQGGGELVSPEHVYDSGGDGVAFLGVDDDGLPVGLCGG